MDIIVIGGGAAGFFAAIQASYNGANVVLLEKSNKLLSKVKISGGGRCNVTNVITEPALLVLNYPRGSKELLGPFTRFGSRETMQWFESKGVRLKSEPDGRMFPVTDDSLTIINCLLSEAKENGVVIRTGTLVSKLSKTNDRFEIVINNNETLHADKVIITTGGSPNTESYNWIRELGHEIISPVPSLFTFNIPGSPYIDLMGLSVQKVRIKIPGAKTEQEGPLLFTHWGLSGPAVLKLSSVMARWMAAQQYHFKIAVNFLPDQTEEEVRHELLNIAREHPMKKVFINHFRPIPSRLWERICTLSGIAENQKWNETGKKAIHQIVYHLTNTELEIKGKTTFKEEFVTCGGVNLKDVDMKTMQSKKMPGLFFAGEVLDIDGITGGFNFQAAWTTGYLAGINASK